jgi:hypothetical protein
MQNLVTKVGLLHTSSDCLPELDSAAGINCAKAICVLAILNYCSSCSKGKVEVSR